MKITYLGHAGLEVQTARATVLCDPWLSPEGTFQASWFQFPDNSHLVTPELRRPTAVVVSHEHLDHVDPWFLAQVPSTIPIIIHRFPSPVLRRKLQAAGPRPIIELPAWEPLEIADGTSVFFVPEESPMNHDVAIVIQADGQTLLNMNDARLAPMQMREIRTKAGGTVDVFALQGAGASWYPMCYEYPPEKRATLSRQKRLAKFGYMVRAIRAVKPTTVIPFAGPPCFLDPELAPLNAELTAGIFPDQQQVVDWLATRAVTNTVVMLPGDAWDAEARVKDADPAWEGFSFADRASYIERYAERRRPHVEAVLSRYPHPSESLWEPFQGYFSRLLEMSPYFNGKIGMRVGFDITGPGGGAWAVDFRPGAEGVYRDQGECSYRYWIDSRWAVPLLAGKMPWEDFFLSCRFHAWRDPDMYNDHLLGLLKFAHAPALDAVEHYETSMTFEERITIHENGCKYRVQRYCPHAGNDLLESGEVLPGGILRCLAHHYEFSLETGACINGTCKALEVERLDPAGETVVPVEVAAEPAAPAPGWSGALAGGYPAPRRDAVEGR
ncbi:MAG TPA: MBL fold metallo-hydrolase [Gemmatimonadaceae bacterium]|nr:MBL fold metallo-hydrolase [Gemmatimonadaceae bacterium]